MYMLWFKVQGSIYAFGVRPPDSYREAFGVSSFVFLIPCSIDESTNRLINHANTASQQKLLAIAGFKKVFFPFHANGYRICPSFVELNDYFFMIHIHFNPVATIP
jgi:hypothetical protein